MRKSKLAKRSSFAWYREQNSSRGGTAKSVPPFSVCSRVGKTTGKGGKAVPQTRKKDCAAEIAKIKSEEGCCGAIAAMCCSLLLRIPCPFQAQCLALPAGRLRPSRSLVLPRCRRCASPASPPRAPPRPHMCRKRGETARGKIVLARGGEGAYYSLVRQARKREGGKPRGPPRRREP